MKLKLPDTIASPADLAALEAEIREYAKWFAHEEIKKRVNIAHTSTAPTLSASAKQILRNLEAQQAIGRSGLDTLLKTLTDYSKNASTITITLAAPAPQGLRTTLTAWCRAHIAPNIFVSFQFNSTILGGMVVRYGSRVFDWSFKRQILDASHTFPEVLRRV